MGVRRRTPAFRGRAPERATLDGLLDRLRDGASAVLVIRGEPGIGKSALLRYCARQAAGCRIVQVAGVESELEMPFAALHQLCEAMLSHLDALPEPQERALRVAFGLVSGSAPDRFLVGLAVLSLLGEAAAERPLVCLVDDAQWLDAASSQVLAFVGRRLVAEPVLLLFAVREAGDDQLFPALPALTIEGLTDDDARALLATAVAGHLDEHVRDRIIAETRGNPLALLELSADLSEAELAGGFAVQAPATVSGKLGDHYLRRVQALPEPTRRLMLLAAADPTGDAALIWRAAQTLGLGRQAAAAADDEQLLVIGASVRFRHPLVRSAAYGSGTPQDRTAAHEALAAATDAVVDPERRVWHLAAAATGPDEEVAGQLERAAARVQARAGLAAAAAFLERSLALTQESGRRAERALAAAQANLQAGAFDVALGQLGEAEAAAVDDLQRAQVEQLRGRALWARSSAREAPVLLLGTARRLEPLDVRLARETYLDAWGAALFAGRLADPGGDVLEVSKAAASAPRADAAWPGDVLLYALAVLIADGRAAAAPYLRQAVRVFVDDGVSIDDWLRAGQFATAAALSLWDIDGWLELSRRQVDAARASGALVPLAIALNARGMAATWCGDFEEAAALVAEQDAAKDVTGVRIVSTAALLLAAYRGRPEEATRLLSDAVTSSVERGEGLTVQMASWAAAVLHNGLGRHEEALAAAEQAGVENDGQVITAWALRELVEAAVRTGDLGRAREALPRLSAVTAVERTDWAAGLEASSRALVSDGDVAERCYREAIESLEGTRLRPDLGRAHLLYGEWLRTEHRPADARGQLRAAHDMFAGMGAEGFAERARRELVATGEKVRKRGVDSDSELTPQEEHIARLARDGRTNPEIGAELFISARTVEWHLRKVFTKLGVRSRKGLRDALPVASHDPGRHPDSTSSR